MRALKAACLVLLLFAAAIVGAQEGSSETVSALPEPYAEGEFPSWAVGLRRFEIVSLGAFPILLFYTRLAFDLNRYVGNGLEAEYAPWPFKNENSVKLSDDEQIQCVLTAAGISLAFGALDAFFMWRLSLD